LKPHETAAELLRHIDEKDLPVDLGGKCQCEGGCLMDEMSGEDDEFTSETITVKKGAKHCKVVAVAANQTLCWDFVVEAHDVGFSAQVGGANIAQGILRALFCLRCGAPSTSRAIECECSSLFLALQMLLAPALRATTASTQLKKRAR